MGIVPLDAPPQADWRRALERHLRVSEAVAINQTLIAPGVGVRGGVSWKENAAPDDSARWLAAGDQSSDEDDGVQRLDLSDDAAAATFLTAWARELTRLHPSQDDLTPTLRAPKAPAARWPLIPVGVIACVLAVAAVLHQRDRSEHKLTDLRALLQRVQADQARVAGERQRVNEAQAQVRLKQQAIETLEQRLVQTSQSFAAPQRSVANRREAFAAMMEALNQSAAGDVTIQSIEQSSSEHRITGICLSPQAASQLASDLGGKLPEHWQVSPARIEPQLRDERIVWLFSIMIKPVVAVVAAP